jgi:NAD(P)-dependent dehydrogenase (short-subunit alcohol dehydrogenase family)
MTVDVELPPLLERFPTYLSSFGSILPEPSPADPADISDAVVFLASDMARTITGTQLTVDLGATKV